jgi:Zn-dependent peptidase ImmA (M78 family)
MNNVTIKPHMFQWACERSGISDETLLSRFPKLELWAQGAAKPTLKQLESFAKATHTPIGYLFLPDPPVERMPIPDFRTIDTKQLHRLSPDLLDTVYICQQRQEWYRDFARSSGNEPLAFVGSVDVSSDVVATAEKIRHALGFDVEERRQLPTWGDALRRFIELADTKGVLVMVSGIVGSNTHRKLDPQEFRGFALADNLAPLVFINGSDTKAAQMFTLAHELAHIWLGQSAVSDTQAVQSPEHVVEQWCNQVAAELLVPFSIIRDEYQRSNSLFDEMKRLAKRFKVSTLVILRRIHDIGGISREQLWQAYREELKNLRDMMAGGSGGGDFYRSQAVRVSKRFARALVVSTLEGQTLHRDAFRLLGFSKLATFHELGQRLGVA